ncbi:capsule assembly Wzi family protein [Pedobacter westerhofensis]|nr:capsule assembly Wzi family protein [Pedobacter westerhofensis]
MIRPIFTSPDKNFDLNHDGNFHVNDFMKLIYSDPGTKLKVYVLPVVWQNQENTHHPYGINDGSMVQARGYETQISAGLMAQLGPLTIQLRPEYVFAENKTFQKLSDAPNGVYWNTPIARTYNSIDLPDRFGDGTYSKVSWGQSSIRLTQGPVSLGLSNENLWWGPGVRSSLLMSNNASGFKHLTLNTVRPIGTYIGSFEAQIVSGRLDQSGVPSPTGPEFVSRPKDWRYFNGLVVTYQPKWIPNFFLGLDRTFTVNKRDMGSSFGDYFPIFKAPEKSSYNLADGTNAEDAAARDQYIAFFTRYVLPESKAEIYFEFGRNDHSYDSRDGLVEPEHSRAYIVGFRKLVPLRRSDEYIQLGVEFTQLQRSTTATTRASPPWYEHSQVSDGYTNYGQVLGAGIGPGSNLQSLDVNWVKGLKKIGLTFERLVNNNDLFYDFAYASADKNQYINRHWVDLSVAGNFAWTYKKFVLNSQLVYIRSLNYQYQWQSGVSYWDWNKQDVNNVHIKVGILYRL